MIQNPWLGLATYDEQAVAQGYKFCGRERAINELYSIIDNNLLTTLYGKSGIGKSSLLQAGVFPRLRAENYLPVMIRLGIEYTATCSYSTLIIEAVRNAIQKINGQCICPQESDTPREEEMLWQFFHTTEFQDGNGDALFPVIVLDQFEEIYYKDKQQLNTLLKSLYLLVDDSSLPMSNDNDAANYRVVLSIREDDLFHLEDSTDKLRLTEMKYNRYRLRELTHEEARNIILRPAKDLINTEESEDIVEAIIEIAKNEDGEINSAILSLVCSCIFDFAKKNSSSINSSSVVTFLNTYGNNIFTSFIETVKSRINNESVWCYLEDELITNDGRRDSVLKSEFEKHVTDYKFLLEGETGILRHIAISSSNDCRIELIHDLFAQQMLLSRNERRFKEQLKQQRTSVSRIIATTSLILLFSITSIWTHTKHHALKNEFDLQIRSNEILQNHLETLDIELKEITTNLSFLVNKASPLEDSTYHNFIKNIAIHKEGIIKITIVCTITPESNTVYSKQLELAKVRSENIAEKLKPYAKESEIQTKIEQISWSSIAHILESQGYLQEASSIKDWSKNEANTSQKVKALPTYADVILPLLSNLRTTKCIMAISRTKESKEEINNYAFGIK